MQLCRKNNSFTSVQEHLCLLSYCYCLFGEQCTSLLHESVLTLLMHSCVSDIHQRQLSNFGCTGPVVQQQRGSRKCKRLLHVSICALTLPLHFFPLSLDGSVVLMSGGDDGSLAVRCISMSLAAGSDTSFSVCSKWIAHRPDCHGSTVTGKRAFCAWYSRNQISIPR